MLLECVAVHAVPIGIGGEAEGAVGGLAAAAATEKTACVAGDLVAVTGTFSKTRSFTVLSLASRAVTASFVNTSSSV